MCQRAPTLRALWATRSTVAAQHSSRTTSSIRSSDGEGEGEGRVGGRGGGGEERGREHDETSATYAIVNYIGWDITYRATRTITYLYTLPIEVHAVCYECHYT